MYAMVNGKQVVLRDGATVADVREALGPQVKGDSFVEDAGGTTKSLRDSDQIKEGGKLYTIPKIVKG